MPRKPIDYSKTHFYKIVCKDTSITDCYVGHTTDFTKRKCQHKSCCLNENDSHYSVFLYDFIRKNGNWNNWDMVLIKTIKCENGLEARSIERKYYEELKASLNIDTPNQTKKEWEDKQSDEWKEKRKAYCRNHYHQNKEKYKQMREENKEHIKEQKKQNYLKKRDEIRKKLDEHFDCPCGGRYTLTHKALHCRTNRHQAYLQTLEATDW